MKFGLKEYLRQYGMSLDFQFPLVPKMWLVTIATHNCYFLNDLKTLEKIPKTHNVLPFIFNKIC